LPTCFAAPYQPAAMFKLDSVLLVDDDHTTNYLNQLLLKRLSITDTVLVALNGQEALDTLLARYQQAPAAAPVLVLLDVKMPVMDGFEFLEAYSQLSLAQQNAIVIVMLTTSLHPADVERMRQLNIAGFMSKPLTQAKLEDVLKAHFAWQA
jgi:CheY-like chemotaxis protein